MWRKVNIYLDITNFDVQLSLFNITLRPEFR